MQFLGRSWPARGTVPQWCCSFRALLLSALVGATSAVQAMSTQLQADVYSPALPIDDFLNDWQGRLDRQATAASAHAELRLQPLQTSNLQVFWRYDYTLRHSQDMSQLYWQFKNKQLLDPSSRYRLWLDAEHLEFVAVSTQWRWPLADWGTLQIEPFAGLTLEGLSGQFEGDFSTVSGASNHDRLLAGQAALSYQHNSVVFKKLDDPGLNSRGWTLGADVSWLYQSPKGLRSTIRAQQPIGWAWWTDHARTTTYHLDHDQNRLPQSRIEGQAVPDSFRQRLPWLVRTDWTWPLVGAVSLEAHSLHDRTGGLYQLGVGHAFFQHNLSGGIELPSQAFWLAIEQSCTSERRVCLQTKLISDSFSFNQARRLGLALSLQLALP